MKLTVFFEEPFWVGIVELTEDGVVKAGRYVFGSEPSQEEILDFVRFRLLEVVEGLSCGVATGKAAAVIRNPKRRARAAAKESRGTGGSTFSQQAIKLEQEKRGAESARRSKAAREELALKKREIARQKAKDKHRGR
ncbi:YjdF family protein [Paenibacillus sp. BAC0078]